VGEVEPWNSGDAVIPFTVTGASYSGISVSFSTDAGYSWTETRNFTLEAGSVVWDTNLELPHMTERQVAVKLTPYTPSGNGECGISGIFRVGQQHTPRPSISARPCSWKRASSVLHTRWTNRRATRSTFTHNTPPTAGTTGSQ
jgi:hypothetical protein